MTKKEKQARLDRCMENVLTNLDLETYLTLKSPDNIKAELAFNRQIVWALVDAARAVGKDFSGVIR